MRTPRHFPTAGTALVVAIGALSLGAAPSVRAEPPTSTTSAPTTTSTTAGRVVQLAGLQFTVPAEWPVYDLTKKPRTCVRVDRHAAFVGPPGTNQDCPARPVGHTEAMLLERVVDAGTAATTSITQPGSVNGLPVRMDPNPSASGALSVLFVDQGVLVYLSYGSGRAVVDAILASARPAPAPATDRPTTAPPPATSRTPVTNKAPVTSQSTEPITGVTFTGFTFDICKAPTTAQMLAWLASPYRAIGVYIGGNSAACPPNTLANPNLTAAWVQTVGLYGWSFLPLFVGSQAPSGCNSGTFGGRVVAATAATQGTAEANDAANKAALLGFGPAFGGRPGSPIYFDMEAYTDIAACTTPVLNFIHAWVHQIRARGYTAGFYSSGASGIADQVATCSTPMPEVCPDQIWFAHWNNVAWMYGDPYMPEDRWIHQRHHQYKGGHDEPFGGVTLNIDSTGSDGMAARSVLILRSGLGGLPPKHR